ncbi:hypothetical protein RIF25_01810 [Thermosynechococcaceae cyanobacterium BACA0444]|uniref:Uncharacterized protein n=1 Tax=Pseudocalidococcus azoricus BACA0444 TaxID=2918990 RepID=A0AAE4FP55_9CYAN|nr:hypothetical protein [Pseudocalidococcus azoricus]MDS3859535.1 hypothetical protein [Pseudocalidococcus azoricus BACA0444]
MSDQLGDSLTETLAESELSDLSSEIAEVALDSFLQDGFLKDLPVINIITGLWKTGVTVRDFLLTKKLIYFLNEIQDIPAERRKRMLANLERDKEFRGKVGDNLMLLIDRLDSLGKARFLGKAFRAYVNESFDSSHFWDLALIIDRLPSHYIQKIRDWQSLAIPSLSSIEHQLYLSVGVGIFDIRVSGSVFGWNEEICELLCNYILNND